MEAASAKWQMLVFSGVLHAYTDDITIPGVAAWHEPSTRYTYALTHQFIADAFAGRLQQSPEAAGKVQRHRSFDGQSARRTLPDLCRHRHGASLLVAALRNRAIPPLASALIRKVAGERQSFIHTLHQAGILF